MQDAAGMQARDRRRDAAGHAQGRLARPAGARRHRRRGCTMRRLGGPARLRKLGSTSSSTRPALASGWCGDPAQHRDQPGMGPGRQAGRHLAVRPAVAGHGALEQLHRDRPEAAVRLPPIGLVDHAGGAFAELVLQRERRASRWPRVGCASHRHGLGRLVEGIAREGQPRQARQREQPAGQRLEAVGRHAHAVRAPGRPPSIPAAPAGGCRRA